MQRLTIPIHEIIVEDRQRKDLGDIGSLAESLSKYGLIQPIVLSQTNRLIAGGRRLAAATHLGWDRIDVVYRETLTEDELFELELEENIRRKSMHWTEECKTIAKIHQTKVRLGVLGKGTSWGQKQTSELFGMAVGTVNYVLKVNSLLQKEEQLPADQRRFHQCDSINEAWRLYLRDEQERIEAELAKRQQESKTITGTSTTSAAELADKLEAELDEFEVNTSSANTDITNAANESDHVIALRLRARQGYHLLNENEARSLYLSNPLNPPEQFEQYHKQRLEIVKLRNTLNITNTLINGDSIAHMRANPNTYDHIITDIPYGIDMDMLNQQNPHGGQANIDQVLAEHDVDYNKQLIKDFFPAAFSSTKDGAFVITWCDIMLWQYMYDLAIAAGFRVQRWPITWVKTHQCMNQSAQFNFTKSTEIAIVCRKPNTTLVAPQSNCVISASNRDAQKQFQHPFAKPFEIWEYLVNAVSIEGQLILEPFAGRGSGVVSMLKLKRHVIGVELNTAHYNALLENVKQHYLTINPNFVFQ